MIAELFLELSIEFVPVSVALADQFIAIDPMSERTTLEAAGETSESHRSTEVVNTKQIAQLVDHLVSGFFVALG